MTCPNCGAPNDQAQRSGSGIPKTIPELQQFCARHRLPLAKMRFFIGQDYRQPRAFGIYEDEDGNFVVYKNKADGSRAIRYRGKDEAYAVNEIYQKMKAEVTNQRSHRAAASANPYSPANVVSRSAAKRRKRGLFHKIKVFCIVLLVLVVVSGVASGIGGYRAEHRPHTGYYSYNGNYYYNQNDSWYTYDDNAFWIPAVADEELIENSDSYYQSYSYSSQYDVTDFSDSAYYVEPDTWSDDWDDSDWSWSSSSDYDSGWDSDSSWDSDFTDWDSDW